MIIGYAGFPIHVGADSSGLASIPLFSRPLTSSPVTVNGCAGGEYPESANAYAALACDYAGDGVLYHFVREYRVGAGGVRRGHVHGRASRLGERVDVRAARSDATMFPAPS